MSGAGRGRLGTFGGTMNASRFSPWWVGFVLALGCGGEPARPDVPLEPPDTGMPDAGPPPPTPHPCTAAPGACLDWIVPVGSSRIPTFVNDVISTATGAILVGGADSNDIAGSGVPIGTMTLDPLAPYSSAAFFAEVDRSGNLVRGATFNPTDRLDQFRSGVVHSSGDLVLAGYANVDAAAGSDHQVLVVRARMDGSMVWSQTLGPTRDSTGISFATEYADHVAIGPDGSVLVSGTAPGMFPGATGPMGDGFLIALDPDTGGVRWARSLGEAVGRFIAVVDGRTYVSLDYLMSPGTRVVDLGEGVTLTLGAGYNSAVVEFSAAGLPLRAWHLPDGNNLVMSLEPDGAGLLVGATSLMYDPSRGTSYSGAYAYHLDLDLTGQVVASERGTNIAGDGAFREADGTIGLVGNAGRRIRDRMVTDYVGGYDPWIGFYDTYNQPRGLKFDGEGFGTERMRSFPSTDGRVYLSGFYTQTFQFETLFVGTRAGSRFGGSGYVIQMSLP